MKNIFFFFQISLGWRFSASANFSPTLKPDSDPEASGTVPTVQFSYVVMGQVYMYRKIMSKPRFCSDIWSVYSGLHIGKIKYCPLERGMIYFSKISGILYTEEKLEHYTTVHYNCPPC